MNGSIRISGTYWERALLVVLPIPMLLATIIAWKNWNDVTLDGLLHGSLIFAILVIGISLADHELFRRYRPVLVESSDHLSIGGSIVLPSAISSITPVDLYRHRMTVSMLRIEYLSTEGLVTIYALHKPRLILIGWLLSSYRSITLLTSLYPELKVRVKDHTMINFPNLFS